VKSVLLILHADQTISQAKRGEGGLCAGMKLDLKRESRQVARLYPNGTA
jgi:hypothetical protein